MRYFRNKEFRMELIGLLVLCSVAIACMDMWCSRTAAIYLSVFCCAVFCFFFGYNVYRYRRMAGLAEQIDRILHGEEVQIMEHCNEGEFAVLATSVDKMVQRLLEQQSILHQEKAILADSMADISHQMKTPLTSISLLLNLLQEEQLSQEKRLQYVQDLMKLTGRMEWMVYALLRMAKLDAGTVSLQHTAYRMEHLLRKAVEPLEIALDIRNIALEMQMQSEITLNGDISWMAEAVSNILKNCMEHTPSGGCIRIVTKDNPLYVLLEISDSGSGFTLEDLPHIFERFYRGKNADANSVGIGLALAKRIILSQNGTIKAYNHKKHGGAVFEIRLYKGAV